MQPVTTAVEDVMRQVVKNQMEERREGAHSHSPATSDRDVVEIHDPEAEVREVRVLR